MIRELTAGEAHLLLPLNAIVQQVHADRKPTHFRVETDPAEVLEFFQTCLATEAISALIAEDALGRSIGYVMLEVHDVKGSALTIPRRRGFVHHIAVLPDWRRQGVASALLEAAKARFRAQGLDDWATSYWCFNTASAALMQKHGLVPAHLVAEGSL